MPGQKTERDPPATRFVEIVVVCFQTIVVFCNFIIFYFGNLRSKSEYSTSTMFNNILGTFADNDKKMSTDPPPGFGASNDIGIDKIRSSKLKIKMFMSKNSLILT